MTRTSLGLVLVLGTVLALLPSTARAQRRGGKAADTTLPVATNTLLLNPDIYYGKVVTVTAGVETVVASGAFVVDQKKVAALGPVVSVGSPLLVIAPRLSGSVTPTMQLAIKGQIVRLDAATLARLARESGFDATSALAARYDGMPALVATSVLTSTQDELVR